MIRDRIVAYLGRASDYILSGRNRSRIVLGTDRKNTRDSGYGDLGQDDVESSSIDLVAGYDPDSGDPDMKNDKSRIYIAQKTDPDSYFDIQIGDAVSGESGVITISDHIRIKGRKTVKIVGKDFSIIVNDQGEATINCQKMNIVSDDIKLGSSSASEVPAWASKVLSELQKLQITLNTGATPIGGGTVTFATAYIAPEEISQIGATKTKIE